MQKKILVVAPAWLGDLVMSQAVLKLIKESSPGAIIDVLAAPYLHPILKRMPEVNDLIALPFKHGELNLMGRFRIGKSLRARKYDHAYVLPNSLKSALIPFFAKIPLRTGWRGEMRYGLINDIRILDKKHLPLMVEQYLALGLTKNEPFLTDIKKFYPTFHTDQNLLEKTLNKFSLSKESATKKPILAFCYGGEYGPSKRWPTKYFAEVAKTKHQDGWQVWLFGGKKDKPLADEIQKLSGNVCVDFTGRTDLSEACDLLSIATLVLTNDTGLMHIAAALERPLLAIYGSTSPSFTPPLFKEAEIVRTGISCSPCFKRVCPLGHFKCMLDLTPDKIIEKINAYESTNN